MRALPVAVHDGHAERRKWVAAGGLDGVQHLKQRLSLCACSHQSIKEEQAAVVAAATATLCRPVYVSSPPPPAILTWYQSHLLLTTRSFMLCPKRPLMGRYTRSFLGLYPHDRRNGVSFVSISSKRSFDLQGQAG